MDISTLNNDELLKLHPDTAITVRKMYNLDNPIDLNRAIDALEEWLKKQYHLTKRDFPRDFLERSIIALKGSVERAKSQIDNMCAMRTIFPIFFDKCDARNDFESMNPVLVDAILPTLTEDHTRVYIAHFKGDGVTKDILMDTYKFGMLKGEYIKANDYNAGFKVIVDFRNISVTDFLTVVDFTALHQLIRIQMEGLGVRVKGIHGVSSSKAMELLVKILKPLLGPKVSQRLYFHKTVDALYEYFPREILPPQLGGYGECLETISDRWKNVFGREENVKYMREMSKVVSNEAYRMKEKLNNLDLGLAGTFRALSVD